MAIQVRRGLKADFDPTKMLPGEWAVSTDSGSSNQMVWMCFAAGIVKRMGTYEDFIAQIREATDSIKDEYIAYFNEILTQIQAVAQQASDDKDAVIVVKKTILNEYMPLIISYKEAAESASASASESASTATNKATESANSATLSESYAVGGTGSRTGEDTDNSFYYKQQTEATYREFIQGVESGAFIGPQGPQGQSGKDGQDGESGVTVPLSSFFTLSVDGDGNLYAYSQTDMTGAFEFDSATGNFYMITEG